jgi:uncharacterized membrane protein YdjX (TVP38/TMEM64 family)
MPDAPTGQGNRVEPDNTGRGWQRPLVLVGLVAVLMVGVWVLPVGDYLGAVLDWTQGLGVWGPVVVAGFYIVACVLFLPGSVLTLGAGFLFNILVGTVTVSIGSTLGACTAFLVGRKLVRGWVAGKVAGNARFAAIDDAVGRQGFKIVLLVRLSPVFPFNLLNYAFGLTKVSFWRYALASWIGMLPGTVMYVYLGSAARSLADVVAGRVEGGAGQRILFGVGLAVTGIVVWLVTRVARQALRESVPDETAQSASEGNSQ